MGLPQPFLLNLSKAQERQRTAKGQGSGAHSNTLFNRASRLLFQPHINTAEDVVSGNFAGKITSTILFSQNDMAGNEGGGRKP